ILGDPARLRFFINSYVVAICVVILTLVVAIHAAYAFSRFRFRLSGPLKMLIISVQAVPPITVLIPYFGIIVAFKMYDTYAGLIFTYMLFTLPYAIIMMTSYLNSLPRELDEAV